MLYIDLLCFAAGYFYANDNDFCWLVARGETLEYSILYKYNCMYVLVIFNGLLLLFISEPHTPTHIRLYIYPVHTGLKCWKNGQLLQSSFKYSEFISYKLENAAWSRTLVSIWVHLNMVFYCCVLFWWISKGGDLLVIIWWFSPSMHIHD